MYDIILFTDVTDTVFIQKAIGAYKCANELRKNGFSCLVVDNFHAFTESEIVELLNSAMHSNTLFVGTSTTFLQCTDVEIQQGKPIHFKQLGESSFVPQAPQGTAFEQVFFNSIKEKNPNCKIIVGGAKTHPNYKNKFVDAVFIGLAEDSIVKYAQALRDHTEIAGYKNIWGVQVIKSMADEGYDFNNSTMSWADTDVIKCRVLPFEVARGCIFKCKFCAYPLNGKHNLDFIRSKESMMSELQTNYDRFGISSYFIIDDTFNDSEFKLDMMLEVVRGLTFKPIFWAYNRLDLIARNLDIVHKLYEIGVRAFYFGIETMHPKSGRTIGKGYNREKMKNALSYIKSTYPDVVLHGSFIVGLPDDSLESNIATFDQIMSREIQLDTFRFNGLQLYNPDLVAWNSELALNYSKYEYVKIEDNGPAGKDINWKNNYTNRDDAQSIADSFNERGRASGFFKFPGQDMWALQNYGYQFDDLNKMLYKDADWYGYSQAHEQFLIDYKKELFGILKS